MKRSRPKTNSLFASSVKSVQKSFSKSIRGFPPLLHFSAGCIALLGLVLVDLLWEQHSRLILPPAWLALKYAVCFISLKWLYVRWLGPQITWPRFVGSKADIKSVEQKVFLGVEFLILSGAVTGAAGVLTYLTCAWPTPLIDPSLAQADRFMGFDWQAWFMIFSKPWLFVLLQNAYYSLFFQTILFVSWFSFWENKSRLYEVFWILSASVIVTAFAAGLWPAVGPVFAFERLLPLFDHFQPLGHKIFAQVTAIKGGIIPDFTKQGLTGIITFPSFHTAMAVAFIYGFRRTGLLGYGIILLNIAVLISIPFVGNHYLTDMIAGFFVALLTIILVRIIKHVQPKSLP